MASLRTKIIAEIGINHNGSLDNTKRLIDVAKFAGCDFVKFQKRNPDKCVPENQKNVIKKTPWGEMTYLEYKKRIEFNEDQYTEIDKYCKEKGIGWFASVWDMDSTEFMSKFSTKIGKIPSALATNDELICYARSKFDTLLISTGMCTEEEVKGVIEHEPNVIFHTNSTYPCPVEELNLRYICWLKDSFDYEIGYSGHENGLTTTFAAVAMGCTWIERHVCLSHQDWGTDQSSSLEPIGLIKLVKGIRDIELALGTYGPRNLTNGEIEKAKSLKK